MENNRNGAREGRTDGLIEWVEEKVEAEETEDDDYGTAVRADLMEQVREGHRVRAKINP